MRKYPIQFQYKSHMISSIEGQEPIFKEYSYRFIIVTLYSLASFINGMCWVVVTPISVSIQQAYNVPAFVVAFIPMSYMLFFILINFPSNWVLDVKGIKKGVITGTALTCLGCGIRCMVKFSFYFVVVGQVFCAVAQPFLINAPMKVAARWFTQKNRSLAMAILTVVNIIGTAVGFLIPPLFVFNNEEESKVRSGFFLLLMFQFGISALCLLLNAIFFREKPPTLPSLGEMTQKTEFMNSFRILFKDKVFLSLAFAFGTVNGTFNIYGSLMDDILDPFGFTSGDVSTLGAGLMVSGIISAALFGLYVEKTLKYRRLFILCSIVGLVTTVGFPLSMKFLNYSYFWVFMILVILQGIVFIPLQPLTIDYASDIMFPVGQAQITGFMLTAGQILGVLFVQIAQLVFGLGSGTQEEQKVSAFHSVIFVNCLLAIGCFVLMSQNSQLKRSKLEKTKSLVAAEGSLISQRHTRSHEQNIDS